MSVLLFLVIVIVILALALYAIDLAPVPANPLKAWIKVLFVLIAVVVVAQRFGVLNF